MPIVRGAMNMEGRRRDVVEVLPFNRAPPFIFPTVRTAQDESQDLDLDLDLGAKAQEANDNTERLPPPSQGDAATSSGDADEENVQKEGAGGGPQDKSSGTVGSLIDPEWEPGQVYSIAAPPPQPLYFSASQSLTVDRAEWVAVDEEGKPALSVQNYTVGFPDVNKFSAALIPAEGAQYVGQDMYLVLHYRHPTTGEAQSWAGSVFSVVNSPAEVQVVEDDFRTRINKGETILRGGPSEQFSDAPWRTDIAPSNSGTGVRKDPGKATPTTTFGIEPGGGGGGLSIGAKAGIGVGVGVAFLIALGLLAFFLIRRRRRARLPRGSAVAYPGSLHATPSDYIHDKETHARVADSPQSPSDDARDSTLLQAAETPAGAVAGAAAVHPPENQSPVQSNASPTVETARPEVPAAVAHLVEEGMSEAEIRRLEEEERALDQAIEQAAQRK